jgi:transposase InsO family protein
LADSHLEEPEQVVTQPVKSIDPELAGRYSEEPEPAISQLGSNVVNNQSVDSLQDADSELAGSHSEMPGQAIGQSGPDVVHSQLVNSISLPEADDPESVVGHLGFDAELTLAKDQRRDNPLPVEHQVGTDDRKQTRVITVQALCALPWAKDSETDHLVELVRSQVVTRKDAREAVQGEDPLVDETAQGLIDQILKYQGVDPWCIKLKKELEATTSPDPDSLRYQSYSITQDGLLRYQGRLVVPQQKSLIHELLHLYHDDQFAGHWGIDKTRELLGRKFYWQGMSVDIREYVTTCSICQNNAIPRHKPYGQLNPLPIPLRPWEEVSLDFITHLPPSYIGTQEFTAILVVVDRFTKMARFIPTRDDLDAPEFAALFHESIELKYGSPRGIVSDRDTRITSKFWAEVCAYSLIKRRMSTAFHPQTDGQTEILNRILEGYLRSYTNLEQMNWSKLLPAAEFAYNNSWSSSTKTTPFKALYGYDPELRFNVEDNANRGEAPAAHERVKTLQELRDKLRDELLHSQERQAKYYNKRHEPKLFKRGEFVKLSTRNLKLKDKKLQQRWIGPLRVLKRIGVQAYQLALPEKYARLHDVFPVQLIEEYKPREDQPLLPMPDLEDEDEWEIEEVKDKKRIKGEVHYLIKWAGWPTEYNQWIPEQNMENAQEAIQDFERRKRKRKKQQ